MKDGAEKECILVGVNAARRYDAGMLHHIKAALEAGTTLEELAEILSVCISLTWLAGMAGRDQGIGFCWEISEGRPIIFQAHQDR